LWLAPGERVVQSKDLTVFRVVVTRKLTKIQHFEKFNAISKKPEQLSKKGKYLGNVLRLAPGERVVQGKHLTVFTVAVTQKLTEIQHFENFDAISKKTEQLSKKVKYLGNGKRYRNFARDQKCLELFSAPNGVS